MTPGPAEPHPGPLERAHEVFTHGLEWVVLGINAVTVVVLVWGVVCGARRFLGVEFGRLAGESTRSRQNDLRRQVGWYLLFGLELLIAADVIETMIRPTLEQLAILGGVLLIRIATGVALGRELREIAHEGSDG